MNNPPSPDPPARQPAQRALTTGLLPVLLLTLLTTGCHPQLMRPPAMFDGTAADPFATLPTAARDHEATIFYATNRRVQANAEPLAYGAQRAPALTLGRIRAQIGEDLAWADLAAHSRGQNNSKRPRLTLHPPEPYGPLLTTAPPRLVQRQTGENAAELETRFIPRIDPGRAAFRFAQALNAEMDATGHHEIYLYVHGYFNSFTDCIETATSLHHYNGRRGAVVAFGWPSRKHLLDYFADRESAQYSASDLRQLLVFLAKHTDAQRVNLIAHSMGTYLTSSTLRELRLIGFDQDPAELRDSFRIGNVVLVAPDIDVDVLQKVFFREGFDQVAQHLTLYVSPDDHALSWATRLLFGVLRAGSATADHLSDDQRRWLKANPNVSMIDTTGQKTYGIGHSHHTQNPGVSSDLLLLLAHRLPPGQRGLEYGQDTGVWRFPKDYPSRVRTIAEDRYAAKPDLEPEADTPVPAAMPGACCAVPSRFAPRPPAAPAPIPVP